MKSSTRSRSVATSGVGVKSMCSSPRLPLPVAANANSGTAVASEELVVLPEQPGELQLGHAREVALDDPRRVAAGQLRRDREEEIVDVAGALELVVQARAALAEQGADAMLVPQLTQGDD